MLIVGLTGGIASGKTTVLAMLRGMGAKVIDLDDLSRVVVQPGKPAFLDIVSHFGEDIIKPDGTLDREALGRIAFSNPELRRDLESFVHPRVFEEECSILREIDKCAPHSIVVIDVPLLFEFGLQDRMDTVVLVYLPEKMQLRRLIQRNGFSQEEATARLRSQMPIDEKLPMAHFVVDNSGDLEQTRKQVEAVMGELRKMEKNKNRAAVDKDQ
jgi:dephospho-CoA kinase